MLNLILQFQKKYRPKAEKGKLVGPDDFVENFIKIMDVDSIKTFTALFKYAISNEC